MKRIDLDEIHRLACENEQISSELMLKVLYLTERYREALEQICGATMSKSVHWREIAKNALSETA